MPSKSKKQQDFMAAVANNPKFAKKTGVPQSVGKDYEKADKMKGMKKYQRGGPMPARPMPAGMANPQAGVANAPPPDETTVRQRQETYIPPGSPIAPETMERIKTKRKARRQEGARSGRGGMKGGGSVRGAGCATKGVRAAKMVSMKGA